MGYSQLAGFSPDTSDEIHGSYYLDFKDPEDDSWGTIWEDYASTDFIVAIKERSNK